jgi:hypothetical protein
VSAMTVHVNEIHTDVSTTGGAYAQAASSGGGRSTDERWHESHGRAEWLARRVRSEGFSD